MMAGRPPSCTASWSQPVSATAGKEFELLRVPDCGA